LRILKVPKKLHHKFLQVAHLNTLENIETCGILSGILENNELIVTTLIIPNQSGTPDTCATLDEESIFKYQEKLGLLTLGWIHTHPSQTCFLSSVDLHTHCSYQLMLPEAIAIVCAPKHEPNYGVFHLVHPEGIRTISTCRAGEGFHIHANVDQLYSVNEF
ncbi:Mov34-domain-containing protein, partial [Backusella circina FSU 941]